MENVKPSEVKIWSRLGSCGAFGMAMTRLAQRYENLAVITADLCFYSGLERFKASNPDKFYNVGIAEQNMVGVAAGMASEGMNVFATTYATFASMRACDQVKVNMGYMRLPVKLVGMTGGLTTGILGATHTSIEDLAIMRAIPNIVILSPSDALSVVGLTEAAAKYDGPVYIRLTGTMPSPIIYDKDTEFEIGKAKVLADGDDVSIVATGATVATAVNVANALKYEGVECRVVDMLCIKPLDEGAVDKSIKKAKLLVSIEEHSVIGGLGSALADYICDKKAPPLLKIGIDDRYEHAQSYETMLQKYGLTEQNIIEKIKKKLGRIK